MNQPFETLTLAQLRERTSVKWRLHPPDVLPMWVAEMDVLPVPAVVDRLATAMADGDTGYPFGRDYQEAFARFARRHWDWDPEPAGALVVADVMTGIRESLLAVTDPGSAVVIPTPVYPPFLSFAAELGREVVEVPLASSESDASSRLDLPALAEVLRRRSGTRTALLICSPHNPTGTVHSSAELSAVAELANQTGATVVVDEVHAPLTVGSERFVPYLSLPGTDAGIVVTSASKAYNLAGLKAALVIPGAAAGESLQRFGEHCKYGASHLGVMSHVAALDHGDQWLAGVVANIAENRQLLTQEIERAGLPLRTVPGAATYLCWVDARGAGLGDDPAAEFLRRGRLAVNSGTHFGAVGVGHVRVNVATSRELIAEGVRRMAITLAAVGRS